MQELEVDEQARENEKGREIHHRDTENTETEVRGFKVCLSELCVSVVNSS